MFVDPRSFYNYYKNTENFNSGIYGIYCSVNNKIYIGQSTRIERRFKKHKVGLRAQTHANKNLQNSWNKYETNFHFFYIKQATKEELTSLEYYFYRLFSKDDIFNVMEPANYSVITKEMKKKISTTLKERYKFGRSLITLSRNQVLEIKDLMLQGCSVANIAKKYSLDRSTIYDIRNGLIWSHLTGIKKGDFAKPRKYSDEDIRKIRLLLKEGIGPTKISKMLNKPVHLAEDLKRGKGYKNVI